MKVKDIMVRDVATLDLNDELTLADDIMKLGRIRHLPVVDKGRLVGIISQRDLRLPRRRKHLGQELAPHRA